MKSFAKYSNTTQHLKALIMELIKSSFHNFMPDKLSSISSCFISGSAYILMAFSADGKKAHCVGTLLFLADVNGIWVNWLVVSKGTYDQTTFGTNATNEPFCGCRFGHLL